MTTTFNPPRRLRLARPRPWLRRPRPLPLLAPVVGLVAVLAGAIAIGHSGFHAEHVFQPHDQLGGVRYTPFLAACTVGFGLAMLVGSGLLRVAAHGPRLLAALALGLGSALVTVAGAAALGLGIAVLADAWPTQMHRWLNIGHAGGVIAVVAGAISLTAAVIAPLFVGGLTAAAAAPVAEPTAPGPEAPEGEAREHDAPDRRPADRDASRVDATNPAESDEGQSDDPTVPASAS